MDGYEYEGEEELLFSPMCLLARLLHKLGLAAPSWRLQGEAENGLGIEEQKCRDA